ncbi:MAG: DNA gyrase inhibitor YacG [Acidobacteriaceae bacterium]|nr:DNA gyrase inhibitor YacG [Acidobacteriaceae bacterium]
MAESSKLRCPTCRATVPIDSENVPFCSDRCRLIDLGKWASGEYVISSPAFDVDPEDLDRLNEIEAQNNRSSSGDSGKGGK